MRDVALMPRSLVQCNWWVGPMRLSDGLCISEWSGDAAAHTGPRMLQLPGFHARTEKKPASGMKTLAAKNLRPSPAGRVGPGGAGGVRGTPRRN